MCVACHVYAYRSRMDAVLTICSDNHAVTDKHVCADYLSSCRTVRMAAAFGAGAAFSLVSGVPNPLQAAVTTGAAFAGFNGLFYQVRCLCITLWAPSMAWSAILVRHKLASAP